jgi:hypothetical protein
MAAKKRNTRTDPKQLAQIIDDESCRLAQAAAIVQMFADREEEADALYGALNLIEDANAKIAQIATALRDVEARHG